MRGRISGEGSSARLISRRRPPGRARDCSGEKEGLFDRADATSKSATSRPGAPDGRVLFAATSIEDEAADLNRNNSTDFDLLARIPSVALNKRPDGTLESAMTLHSRFLGLIHTDTLLPTDSVTPNEALTPNDKGDEKVVTDSQKNPAPASRRRSRIECFG